MSQLYQQQNTINPFIEYESLGLIGRGKYSEVHKARHRKSGQLVALKKVQIFDMDSSGRKEVMNEAMILQSLPHHAHIITYYSSFLYDNDLYLVLELAENGDFSQLLEHARTHNQPFSEYDIWHYFTQICDALQVMHSCRVMHRDIKPQNVFLTHQARIVKLGDLGLGKYLSSKTAETFSIVGTPSYMSPEAISNAGYDFKSDIWR